MEEITFEDLKKWQPNSYVLIDIRDEGLASYGMIPGAVHIPMDELEDGDSSVMADIAPEKKVVLYCQIGRKSKEIGDLESLADKECYSLAGGYIGYIRSEMLNKAAMEENKREEK